MVDRPKRCSVCKKVLRGWNKSLLCQYHNLLKARYKRKMMVREERNEIIN